MQLHGFIAPATMTGVQTVVSLKVVAVLNIKAVAKKEFPQMPWEACAQAK